MVPSVDLPRLAAATVVTGLAGVASAIFLLVFDAQVSLELVSSIAMLGATFLVCIAIVCVLLYRVSRDCAAVRVAVIAGLVGPAHLLAANAVGHARTWAGAAALASLPALWHYAQLSRTHEIDTTVVVWKLVVSTVAAVGLVMTPALLVGVPPRLASTVMMVGWAAGTLALARTAVARRRHLTLWLVLFGCCLVMAGGLGIEGSAAAALCSSVIVALVAAMALGGVMVEVRRAYAGQQRAAMVAIAEAASVTMRSQAVDETNTERLHEARAALAGIGAAAQSISRFRDYLEPWQFEELSNGMVKEVARLRELIEDDAVASVEFEIDVADAITPVIACARADGLDVLAELPTGVMARSSANVIAQAVTSLVVNAKRHAGGSRIEIGLAQDDGDVLISVEDGGPGLAAAECERIFERGVSTNHGSGLGLYVARSQLSAIGGEISAEPRNGGGARFTIRLPGAHRRSAPWPTRGQPTSTG